jgi:predicted PurR-regulated permease PerM
VLAVAIIVAYKVINELSYFTGIVKTLWRIVTPFFYGFLLAYIINVPCAAIQKLLGKSSIKFISKRKNGIGLIIIFIIFALIIYSFLNLIVPYISQSAALFVSSLPSYYESTLGFIDYLNNLEFFDFNISPERIMEALQGMFQNFSIESLASPINAIFGVSSAIFSGFLTIISSIYLLIERDKFRDFARRFIKAFTSESVFGALMEYGGKLNRNFKQYIKTQTIDGLILGTIVTIELYIIGSPYFLMLGLMLGIVNYIPYFGSIIGTLIAVVVVAFTQGMSAGLIAAAVLLITQQIDGNIIQPRLMGGSFSLSPLLVIISITIGGAFAGILGMIAAIPIVAVLKDILDVIIAHYERRKAVKVEGGDET